MHEIEIFLNIICFEKVIVYSFLLSIKYVFSQYGFA